MLRHKYSGASAEFSRSSQEENYVSVSLSAKSRYLLSPARRFRAATATRHSDDISSKFDGDYSAQFFDCL
jgi:hypothetical protein